VQQITKKYFKGGAYQQAIGVLYAIAYTIKMSYKGEHKIDGFFEYVVPPLGGCAYRLCISGHLMMSLLQLQR